MKIVLPLFFCLCLLGPFAAPAAEEPLDSCIAKELRAGADELTLGEIRARCEIRQELLPETGALIDKRRKSDLSQTHSLLTLVPYKPNYLIGSYYFNRPQTAPFEAQFPDRDISIDPAELKFQISLKTMLARGLLGDTGDLWVGYTNRSFWQAFNAERSHPFRETNHEPEVWLDLATDLRLGDLRFRGGNIGFSHQSNGQFGELSRSWNRIFAHLIFQQRDTYFAFKPWWRIPESAEDDDNPDIDRYLGHFEFYAVKEWGRQTLGIMVRDNLRLDSNNKGAVQLDYTFPLHNQLRGYVQWFFGYGESLIDYDHEVNTIGFGIMLANWL